MNFRIKKLEQEIISNKNLYYQGKAKITDEEYDKLEDELRKINPDSFVLSVVGETVFSSDKVEHETRMLSLNKSYSFAELMKWKEKEAVVSTYKIDGSSCSLIYDEGQLMVAKTRGDGKFGENITPKILNIALVPKRIQNNSRVEIRGEVYIDEQSFKHLCEDMVARGLERPNSMRNIVAGILGRKENIDLSRYLSFQAFEYISNSSDFEYELDKFKYLKEEMFEIPEVELHNDKKSIEEKIKETEIFMSEGNYLIDGIVFTINSLKRHMELGNTAHHPRYKMAYKFQGDTQESIIESISWQVSRNGFLTPVANIVPVDIGGAQISRVTLHNFGMVKTHQLKHGDKIGIIRSGEVIPKFISVIESCAGVFSYPSVCPSCNESIREEDIRLICDNKFCPDRIKDEILNFVKKIGIDDLSSKRLEELIKKKYVKDIPSLFTVTREDFLKLDKVKEKLADKLITNIQSAKETTLPLFLASLGISGGAINKCERIVNNGFNTIEKVMGMTAVDLAAVDSFAEKSSTDFVNSLQSKKIIVDRLLKNGFVFKTKVVTGIEGKLSGMKFCITGTLTMKRNDLQKIIKENGGEVMSSVTSKTSYLITNDTESTSSKFIKANQQNIPIINEEKIIELIK